MKKIKAFTPLEKNNRKRYSKNKKTFLTGFSLAEVVCSLAIISLALVAIIGVFSFGARTNKLIEQKTIAYNLLQRKMEEIKQAGYGGTFSDENYGFDKYTFTIDNEYKDLSLSPQVNGPLQQVDVTITWTNAFGQTSTETISTLLANKG